MLLNMLKGKIHCATVTEANLAYMGSITIDEELMEKAGILPNERVQVVDNNNGSSSWPMPCSPKKKAAPINQRLLWWTKKIRSKKSVP